MQAWQVAAHAECVAQRMLEEQEAQEGIDNLGLNAKPAGAILSLSLHCAHRTIFCAEVYPLSQDATPFIGDVILPSCHLCTYTRVISADGISHHSSSLLSSEQLVRRGKCD